MAGCLALPTMAFSQDSKADAENRDALVLSMRSAWTSGEFDKAIEILDKIIAEYPSTAADAYHLRGELNFANLNIDQAVADFDKSIELRPESKPYKWQRGIALYYANEFAKGVDQFASHQSVNRQDVENSVWHLLCKSSETDLETARNEMIPIQGDARVPMAQIFELFKGTGTFEDVNRAATDPSYSAGDRKRYEYYANLYLGLYFEASGDQAKSLEFIRAAKENNPLPLTSVMGQIPRVHLELRDKSRSAESQSDESQSDKSQSN